MAQFFIKNPDGTPSVYEFNGPCTIGRHPGSTILLDHDSVSVHHAEVFIHNGAYMLKDLISSNGTYVNGGRIMIRPLKDGDQIKFGKVEASVSIDTVPEAPVEVKSPAFLNKPSSQT
jgi:adenylate cyclase